MSNQEPSEKYAELCTAIRRGNKLTARQLILNNASVNSSFKLFFNTPLHWAVIKFEDTELIEILLEKNADVHAQNYRHETPLFIAVQLGKTKIVELFLTNNHTYSMKNIKSLIYTATTKKYDKIVKLLVNYSSINHPLINLDDSFNMAVEKGSFKILKYIFPYCKLKTINSRNKRVFIDACYNKDQGYKDCVNYLLQRGFPINLALVKNDNFIHKIVENGHLKITESFLKLGVDINKIDEYTGLSLLHRACMFKHVKIAQLLIDLKADVNMVIDEKTWNHLYFCSSEQLTKFHGKTCLYIAVDNLDVEMTKLLLDNGANLIQDPNYFEIINLAMRNEEIFKTLLDHGVDVNATFSRGRTLLHLCASCEYYFTPDGSEIQLKVAKLIFAKGANVNAQSLDGNTPIYDAIRYQSDCMAQWLLKNHANPMHKDKHDNSLLHIAAGVLEGEDTDLLEDLLKYKLDVNAKNKDGSSPLHIASEHHHWKMVNILLDHNADIDAMDINNKTPLSIACEKQHLVAEDLLKRHANPNTKDKYGNTPLHYACKNTDDEWTLDIIKCLLKNKADINAVNAKGQTPFFNACRDGDIAIIKCLLKNKANVNHIDAKGLTPIWFTTDNEYSCSQIIKLLLEHGANVHLGNYKKKSLIHFVAEHNYVDVIENLLKININLNVVNKKGCTALHTATENGDLEMVKSLLEYGANINIVNKKNQTVFLYAVTRLNELRAEFTDFQDNNRDNYYFDRNNAEDVVKDFAKRLVFYEKNIFTYSEIIKVFRKHIVKLKCAKLKINQQNMDVFQNEDEGSDSDSSDDEDEDLIEKGEDDFKRKCELEVEQMKMEKIGIHNINLYDLLTNSIYSISKYLKNKKFKKILDLNVYNNKFPLYINIIKSRLAEGLLRRKLLVPVKKYLESNIFHDLPPICIDGVLSFLNTKDLKMFLRAVRPLRKKVNFDCEKFK